MNKYQKILTIVALIAFSSITANGMIGQTPDQKIKHAQHDKDIIKVQTVDFGGRPQLEVVYRDGTTMNHLIGRNGREIAFDLYAPKRLTNDDVAAIQRQYKTPWYGTGTEDGVYSWQTISGLQMRAYRREAYDYLVIWDLNKPQEAADIIARVTAANNPAPTPAPQNPVVQAPNQKNDCPVLATEMYARLKKTGVWVGIARFNEKTLAPSGHAVVIWQPASGSNVHVFLDETIGTLELDTQSHDLNEIFAAFNRAMGGFCNFQYLKWTAS